MLPIDRNLLAMAPPSAGERRFAFTIIAVLAAAALMTAPFAERSLGGTEAFLPAYASAVLIIDALTAALLLVIYSVNGLRAVMVLAVGYLFTGLMIVPWLLTFPGVSAFPELLEAGIQSTAWIAAVRRLTFPLFVLAYTLMKDRSEPVSYARRSVGTIGAAVLATVAATVAAAVAATALIVAGEGLLPAFMVDDRQTGSLWIYVPIAATALALVTMVVLFRRSRSAIDIWLLVVLATFVIELALLSFLSGGRFSVGWWAGRTYGLVSTSVVLIALLAQTASLHVQLAQSVAAERRAREARLTSMEALSAAIAHEVNQPLASMVTNADAALRWLGKPVPDLEEARAALRRIASDGHRAGRVVESIRTMVKKAPHDRLPVDLNRLAAEAVSSLLPEAQSRRVQIESDLDTRLPPVIGDPAQLRQVAVNLLTNGMQAMDGVPVPARILRIASSRAASGRVLLSVEDCGPGLAPGLQEKIFEPFFTTKAQGMGLGLMFCRTVVEAHGGRLWAAARKPHGAIFRFELPAAEDDPMPTQPTAAGRPA